MTTTKIRLNLNSQALVKTAEIFANGVLLASNGFLLGSGIRNSLRERKREQVTNNLLVAAEVASAIAGLTKVITETVGIRHAKAD